MVKPPREYPPQPPLAKGGRNNQSAQSTNPFRVDAFYVLKPRIALNTGNSNALRQNRDIAMTTASNPTAQPIDRDLVTGPIFIVRCLPTDLVDL